MVLRKYAIPFGTICVKYSDQPLKQARWAAELIVIGADEPSTSDHVDVGMNEARAVAMRSAVVATCVFVGSYTVVVRLRKQPRDCIHDSWLAFTLAVWQFGFLLLYFNVSVGDKRNVWAVACNRYRNATLSIQRFREVLQWDQKQQNPKAYSGFFSGHVYRPQTFT